jgi:hypothetical protein
VETVIDPTREHVASNQARILNAHHQASGMWSCDLRLNDRYCHGQEPHAETLDRSTSDECPKARSKHLDECAEEVDESTEADSPLSTDHIAEATGDQGAHSG